MSDDLVTTDPEGDTVDLPGLLGIRVTPKPSLLGVAPDWRKDTP